MIPSEGTTIGEDDEEDPMVANLEQDEAETETEIQRKRKIKNIFFQIIYFII